MLTIVFHLVLILFFSFILIKATDLLVIALRHLAVKSHISLFTITAVLMALATSFPELSLGLTAALEGTPNLSLGNVVGANIADLAFVVGVATLFSGSMGVHGEFLNRDIYLGFAAGLAPLFLLLDGNLSRVDGLILLAVYGAYASYLFRTSYHEVAQKIQQPEEAVLWRKLKGYIPQVTGSGRDWGRFFAGLALLLFSADMIVKQGQALAAAAGIPVFVVGLILLSLSTTLPELAFSFRAIKDRAISMFFGNILGSIIANGTLVIGLVAVISPIQVVALNEYLLATITFILIYFLTWTFIRSKHRLDQWEAALLVLLYLVFAYLEFAA